MGKKQHEIKGHPLPGAPLFPDNDDDDRAGGDEQASDLAFSVETANGGKQVEHRRARDEYIAFSGVGTKC